MNRRVDRRLDTLVRGAIGAVQTGALRPVTALPPAVRARLAGTPIQVDGNVLDPDLQLLIRLAGLVPDRPVWTVAGRRELMRSECRLVAGPRRELRRVTDLTVRGSAGQLGARLYVPKAAGDGLLVYFHGGGWVVGDLETHDPWLRVLADDAAVRILSVDYRLAPEAEAPAGAEDAIAAFGWAMRHAADLGADPARIGIGGDSAGGNLAAVVAQQTLWRGQATPAFQLLVYPALDLVGRRSSRDLFREGFLLTEPMINWYRDHYTPDPVLRPDPVVSPLLADDLSGLAPAHIVTAGFDPLRDEGAEYAEKLTAAGVEARHVCETAMVHGFASILVMSDGARRARQRIGAAVRQALTR